MRQNGFAVTRNAICLKAQQLTKDAKYRIDATSFKSSMGWCTHCMNCNNLTPHQRTHIAQTLPCDLDYKVSSFHKFVIRERREFQSELTQTDETPTFLTCLTTALSTQLVIRLFHLKQQVQINVTSLSFYHVWVTGSRVYAKNNAKRKLSTWNYCVCAAKWLG